MVGDVSLDSGAALNEQKLFGLFGLDTPRSAFRDVPMLPEPTAAWT